MHCLRHKFSGFLSWRCLITEIFYIRNHQPHNSFIHIVSNYLHFSTTYYLIWHTNEYFCRIPEFHRVAVPCIRLLCLLWNKFEIVFIFCHLYWPREHIYYIPLIYYWSISSWIQFSLEISSWIHFSSLSTHSHSQRRHWNLTYSWNLLWTPQIQT